MMYSDQNSSHVTMHATTIVSVRKDNVVAIAGDGQVSIGQTVMKGNARKVRRLTVAGHEVITGFAGATADAFTLFERLEAKLEAHPGQLMRAAVELAKDWRTDRYLRRLEAMMIVADTAPSKTATTRRPRLPSARSRLLPRFVSIPMIRWCWRHSVSSLA